MSEHPSRKTVLYVTETATVPSELADQDNLAVRAASRPAEALDILRADTVDCVVSEYALPEGDGLAFLDAVREEFGQLPFILFTDSGSEAVASEAVTYGVTEYVPRGAVDDPFSVLGERIRDVLDSHAADAAAESDISQFWTAVIESANVWINVLDRDGTVIAWNRAAEEISGYSAESVVGSDNIWEWLYPDAEYRAEILEEANAILEGETAVEEYETTIQTKAGSERIISWYSHPITDGNNGLIGSVAIGRDVTERQEAERRFQTLIDNLPGVVYRCRNEPGWPMEFVGGECEALTGYDAETLEAGEVGWSEDIIHPDDRDSVRTKLEKALATGDVFELTYRIRTAEGNKRWVWERGQRVTPSTGTGTELLEGFITDITDREEYERQLEEQRNNLELLNKVLRHDIRNDLQVVTLYGELLASEVTGEDEREYVNRLVENAEHATELTETARVMANVMLESAESKQEIDLRRVIEQQLDDVRSSNETAVVTIEGPLPSAPVEANEMIHSVFGNLLQNAIQHNDKDVPEVAVSMSERDGTVVVEVADNGPGIPDERKQTIFGEGEKGLESEGTGLGLYLVKSLVDSHGGEVYVEDNNPAGAVFVVELPKAQ